MHTPRGGHPAQLSTCLLPDHPSVPVSLTLVVTQFFPELSLRCYQPSAYQQSLEVKRESKADPLPFSQGTSSPPLQVISPLPGHRPLE